MPADKLPGATQESILTAITFWSDDNSALMASLIDPELLDAPYDDMASVVLAHRQKHRRPPGREHVDDVFAYVLEDPEHKQHQLYVRLLERMTQQADRLDTGYLVSEVSEFIQVRKLRAGIARAVERYQKGGKNVTEDLQGIFRECLQIRSGFKDYGFSLSDPDALGFLYRDEGEVCKIGIPELDCVGCIPTKQELLVFMAARNRGKSQYAHHCGKYGLLKGWTVFHYTLENSPEHSAARYYQSLFSGVKRAGDYSYRRFDGDNDRPSIVTERLNPNFIIEHRAKTAAYLRERISDDEYRLANLRIRRFPTGKLSIGELERDLDEIQLVHKQKPDLLIIDSPQLMRYDRKNEYSALGEVYIQLRGLAIERNVAIVATHQGNRLAESASTVVGKHMAGSIDVLGIADNVITYSQTASEEDKGLARLYMQKVRNDQARGTICITQHYASGQFCMDSRLMTNSLRDAVKSYIGNMQLEDEGEPADAEDETPKKLLRVK